MYSDQKTKSEVACEGDEHPVDVMQSDVYVPGTIKAESFGVRADQSESERYQVSGQAKVQPDKSAEDEQAINGGVGRREEEKTDGHWYSFGLAEKRDRSAGEGNAQDPRVIQITSAFDPWWKSMIWMIWYS